MANPISERVLSAAQQLKRRLAKLKFGEPVTYIYNPLEYAWAPYSAYVQKFADRPKRVVFLGMNPGPFGMAQTGVPFGEVPAVKNWLGICAPVEQPSRVHPKRPVAGFDCPRSEISGRRLWGFFEARFGKASAFFTDHFVLNYCPLAFMESTGRNRTPDKLPPGERDLLFKACDAHLREVVDALDPEWIIGVGGFAFQRAQEVLGGDHRKLGQILHPSPACPAANRDWGGTVSAQLEKMGVWRPTPAGKR